MPAVIFFACLDLEQKSLFMDGNYLEELKKIIPKKHETCKFLWLSLIGDWKVFLIGVSQARMGLGDAQKV